MIWIAAIGKICVFLSFWLVAPELLGEDRLKQLIGNGLKIARAILLFLFFVGVVSFAYLGSIRETDLNESKPAFSGIPWIESGEEAVTAFGRFVITFGKEHPWLTGVSVLFAAFVWTQGLKRWLDKLVVTPALTALSQNATIRQRLMRVGALFFLFGSLLDFLSLFMVSS